MINNVVNKFRKLAKKTIPPSLRHKINRIYFSFISKYYKGSRVYCPCCGQSFSRFLPYSTDGKAVRDNEQCPGCGSLSRHRLVSLFLEHETNMFRDNLRVLHFAPEDMLQRKFKSMSNIDYLSADIMSPLAMEHMDIMNIPYKDESFDAIICIHVLAHVEDDRKAISEMYRVLKPKGWVIIQTTVKKNMNTFENKAAKTPKERSRAYGKADLCRIYGSDFTARIEKAGFNVTAVAYNDNFSPEDVVRFGLKPGPIYFCQK
jgi:SAM-dependent methyltransferase